jgi:hypothetical protein
VSVSTVLSWLGCFYLALGTQESLSTFNSNRDRRKRSAASAGARELFLSVCGTVLVILLLNLLAIWVVQRYSPNRGYRLVREKWTLLLNLKEPMEWLVLGDSSGNQAVDPAVFDRRLGGRSLNLCTTGNALAVGDLWMLESYLKRFGPPRGVVIVHTYDLWGRDKNPSMVADIPLPWGYWRRHEPPLHLGPGELVALFLHRYVPLYSKHKSLSTLLLPPFGSRAGDLHLNEAGFMATLNSDPKKVKQEHASHLAFVRGEPFELSAENRKALEQLVTLAQRHRFKLYIAHGPLYRGLYEEEAFKAYFEQVKGALSEFAAGNEWVHHVLQEPMLFPAEQMNGVDHVVHPAPATYTNGLAEEILSLE